MTGAAPQPPAEKRQRSSIAADLIVGVTNGVSNVPDAMANALLAGVSPIVGLYALLAGTPAAALTTNSQFMTVTVTAAMAVTVGSALAAVPAGQRDAAVATLAIMVGVFMAIFGLLRGGRLLRFVSNAVMKGFLNGVALLVIVGQLGNITGFVATRSTKLEKAVETALNVTEWDFTTLAVGLVTVAFILAFKRTRLQNFAMLIALVVATAGVYFFNIDVPLVKSVSEIPSGLPMPKLPELALVPVLVVPALSVALIGLVQGGGISKAFTNADGTYPNASRDMIGQGVGNLAAGAFGGMPVGASVSSTAMAVTGGARTRWANVTVGLVIALVLVLLGPLVEIVPLTVLAGILIVVGVSAIDVNGMRDVWNASKESAVIMGITLGSMLVMPVQYAVLLGAALSAVQYVYSSSKDVRVVALQRLPGGAVVRAGTPRRAPEQCGHRRRHLRKRLLRGRRAHRQAPPLGRRCREARARRASAEPLGGGQHLHRHAPALPRADHRGRRAAHSRRCERAAARTAGEHRSPRTPRRRQRVADVRHRVPVDRGRDRDGTGVAGCPG